VAESPASVTIYYQENAWRDQIGKSVFSCRAGPQRSVLPSRPTVGPADER
jgi:hypothetical protein